MFSKRPGSYVGKSEVLSLFADTPTQLTIEENFVEPVKCTNLQPLDYRAPLEFQV
jgi:hypothetical protein